MTFRTLFDIFNDNQIDYFYYTGEITMGYAYAINCIIINAIVLTVPTDEDSVKSRVIDCKE